MLVIRKLLHVSLVVFKRNNRTTLSTLFLFSPLSLAIPSQKLALFFHFGLVNKPSIMRTIRFTVIFVLLALCTGKSFSQVTKISEQVKENFAQQYPDAENVKWYNDVIKVNVQFEVGDDRMDAQYSNKGIWKNTLKVISYDDLPGEVIEGFQKSKYADREVTDTRILYLPGNIEQYRIKVEKNNLQKKYLYFNTNGRLVRDTNTL